MNSHIKITRLIGSLLKVFWLVCAILTVGLSVFVFIINVYDSSNLGYGILLLIMLFILSSPLILLVVYVCNLLNYIGIIHNLTVSQASVRDITLINSVVYIAVTLIILLLGYIQWFIFIPWLWRKLCNFLSRFKKSKND